MCACCDASLSEGKFVLCSCANWVHASDLCSRSCDSCLADFCVHCSAFDAHVCSLVPKALEDVDEAEISSEGDSDCEHAMMAVAAAEDLLIKDQARASFVEKGLAQVPTPPSPKAGSLSTV